MADRAYSIDTSRRMLASAAPDADLIARCSAHPARLAALRAFRGNIDENHPVWQSYAADLVAIAQAPAVTVAGLLAKARVAKLEATRPDGSEDWEWTGAGVMAGDVLGDLLRLLGDHHGPAVLGARCWTGATLA